MERIDLHTHTLASDGSDAPADVVRKAAALGLRAVAVTDHDTFAGLSEARAAGQRCGIEVVPGVELSTVWGGEEVHLLGYFMDTGNTALRALMTRATDERNARNETMVQRLHDAGYPITMDDLHAAFPGQTVLGRPHIAALLVQRGCIASVPDGMRGLLGRGKEFYVPRYNVPLEDFTRALRAAGGVPVVAHIFKYRFDDAQRTAMLAAAADAGALGGEVRDTTDTPQPAAAAQARAAPTVVPQNGLVLAGRSPSDLLRAQTFNKAQADMRQTKALEGLMQSMGGDGSTLDLARSMGTARHLRALTQGQSSDMLRLGGAGLGDLVRSGGGASRRKAAAKAEEAELGQLSARFESGGDGVAAVGYDRNGGTSYGKYQVSSRAGSLGDFLDFLDSAAPDLAQRLRAAGPGNTGSRKGAMPDAWRAIAREQPERFEDLQEAFVRQSHYEPAVEAIARRTSLSADTLSTAMREVIWSTAVQHGPAGAARIFDRADAMSGNPTDPGYESRLISNVYRIRAGQFGSSDSNVQAAVANRFKQEKMLALNLLDGGAAALA